MFDRPRLIARAWKYRLRKDPFEISLIRSLVGPRDTCFDIGSHKCAYTYWLSERVGPGGRVVCFEPQPRYAALAKALWSSTAWVDVEELALSDHSGNGSLYVPPWGPSPGASLEASNVSKGASEVRVRTSSIDDYVASHKTGPVHFIKCDAEGHELNIFRGSRGLLSRDHPIILVECEARFGGRDRAAAVFELLLELGYIGEFLAAGKLRPLSEFSFERDQAVGSSAYANNFLFRASEQASSPPKNAAPGQRA